MKYSLVIPIYNEDKNLPELYRRISAIMNRIDGDVELILINEGTKPNIYKSFINICLVARYA